MRRKITMQADEVEVGMLVHHPSWADAVGRVGAVEEVEERGKIVLLVVAGTATPMIVNKSDYVETFEL